MGTSTSSPPPRPAPPGVGAAFSLFGIPVRVTSSFWIIALLFGLGGTGSVGQNISFAVAWAAIVFVSILLHELGHALTARAFGASPTITLHAMGGLTHYEGAKMSRLQTWLVSFAGPGTGLVVGGLLLAATQSHPLGPASQKIVYAVLWVNIGWSVVNLLPVLPFDGGHMMAAFLGPRNALWTAVISAVVGSGAAVVGLLHPRLQSPLIAVLFGSAAIGAVQQIRRTWLFGADRKAGLDVELVKARAAIARGDAREARAIADDVMNRARTPLTKNGAILVMAWVEATLGRPTAARELVDRLDASAPLDVYLLAAVEDALGAPDRAQVRLESARQAGLKDAEGIKLLIDLHARDGHLPKAIEVAAEELEVLGREAALAVLNEGLAHGAYLATADLAARMFEAFGEPADAISEARASALAGDRGRTLLVLERIAGRDPVRLGTLRDDAAFESLRGDDRFERLLRGAYQP